MNWKRTAAIVLGTGACAAWMAAAATSGRVAPAGPARPAAAVKPGDREARLAAQIERLHGRLTPAEAPHGSRRNPFSFAPKVVVSPKAPAPSAASRPALVEAPAAMPVPAALPFKLAGIAEDSRDGSVQRTAILSTPTTVLLVKEGDLVPPRYRVSKISADVLELAESGTDVKVRLALK